MVWISPLGSSKIVSCVVRDCPSTSYTIIHYITRSQRSADTTTSTGTDVKPISIVTETYDNIQYKTYAR